MAANRSAGCAAEFENIGRNVAVVSKSGPVETGPTILVATALYVDMAKHNINVAPHCTHCTIKVDSEYMFGEGHGSGIHQIALELFRTFTSEFNIQLFNDHLAV